jgi:hypothetical protein
MARSSADDMDLKRACEAGILSKEKVPEKVALSMRVAKGRVGPPRGLGIAGKLTSRHNQGMAKPRVLAVTSEHFNGSIYLLSIMHAFILMHLLPFFHCVRVVVAKAKGQKTKAFLRVLKYSNGGILEVINLFSNQFNSLSN